MHRTWAIIERELRRFRRSPMLIVMSLIFPLVQLVVLGYAFGGNVSNLTVARRRSGRRRAGGEGARAGRRGRGQRAGPSTPCRYADEGEALQELRTGRVNGVLTIPPDFSRRVAGASDEPRVALIEDNTDNFVAATLAGVDERPGRGLNERRRRATRVPRRDARSTSSRCIPTCRTSSTCCPDRSSMSIFMMVMIGGGIIFIDDKARGLHEGYLVTPITRLELIAGFNLSGTIKAVLAGSC